MPEQRTEPPVVWIGTGTCGLAAGAGELVAALEEELPRLGLDARVVQVGCIGMCFAEPLVDVRVPGLPRISYGHVTPELLARIVESHVAAGRPIPDLALGHFGEQDVPGIPRLADLPFMRSQVRIVLRNCGLIDPEDLGDAIARGGYEGLRRALAMAPEDVVAEVTASGLRGRGGGGFPTGRKWELCRAAEGRPKYLICNADEGDPGAFMDRSVLEGDPHAVLEGMCIAAWAIGATKGYVYARAEYPLAIRRLRRAIADLREAGILGEDMLGSGVAFDVEVKEGAGAFVCGEETALIASIEGRRGVPSPRPPYPAVSGLWGRPTTINNVETFASVASILREGASWFASFGTERSRGTKTFALTGKIVNTGLVEVPMGMPLQQVVDEIGGGIAAGGTFKAAQTGGPSGGCLPARLRDLTIEYESLAEAGSIMGSGGLVIMDESTCMVDLARFFLTFTQAESCGKCTPCRAGTRRMLTILERICAGEGRPTDLEELERLAPVVQQASLCGLGQTAPNPVLTTLRYFRDEYEEHIRDRHCRAAVCPGLVVSPCHHACPAGVKAHRYVREVSQGNFAGAYLVVRESMPLPSVCGTVCYHPCEARCRRAQLDEPVAVRALKGAAVRFGAHAERGIRHRPRPTGKRVAVVGSGPAGLTAAYYAAVKGHDVTVFEELPFAGGMLRTGIPRYRLPEEDLERDLQIVRAAGVEIRTGSRVGSVGGLRAQGYDAVFLALGAHASRELGVPGDGLPGVVDAVSFLRAVSLGSPPPVGARVAVVGGGNTAMDAARTALRLGAREVTVLYRRSREEMPAELEEVEAALEEGVRLELLTVPVALEPSGGGLTATCRRMRLGEPDAGGRRRPVPVEGSEFTVELDTVVSAIGQFPALPEELEVDADPDSQLVAVDRESLATGVEGVFAGGDAVTGPASVVEAIAAGRKAAAAIDRYLGGDGNIEEALAPPEDLLALPELEPEADARPRLGPVERSARSRVGGFVQVERTLSRERAIAEASRCLRCDLTG